MDAAQFAVDHQRHRLVEVNAELEKSTNVTNGGDQLHGHSDEHRPRRKAMESLGAAGYRLNAAEMEALHVLTAYPRNWRPIWD